MDARSHKTNFSSRGQYILSLVPRIRHDSLSDEDDPENIPHTTEEDLNQQLEDVFDVLPEYNIDPGEDLFGDLGVGELFRSSPESVPGPSSARNLHSPVPEPVSFTSFSANDPQPVPSTSFSVNQLPKVSVKKVRNKKSKAKPKKPTANTWKRSRQFRGVTLPQKGHFSRDTGFSDGLDKPLDYFLSFFTDDVIDMITNQSNLYCMQKTCVPANFTHNTIRDFLAIEILQGVVPMPAVTDYWSANLRWEKVASIMPLKQYQKIRRYIHFTDNSEYQTTTDRYYKIRPLMEKIRERCLEVDGDEEKYSIDETMVPYKGKKAGSLRQFMKDKPSRWGYKMFVRSGTSGMIYDFMPYSGDSTFEGVQFSLQEENFLLSEKCVVALALTIPNPPLHALYFDNFYSSIRLMLHLRNHYGLLSLGTFRANRTEGANTKFVTDRELVKKGRGSYDELVHESKKVTMVKWVDNKIVLLGSTYVGSRPAGSIKRWVKGENQRKDVPCPRAIFEYNSFMGGVDLGDMLCALYRTTLRSHRYYMPIFAYLVDVALVNSWLLFRKRNPHMKLGLKDFKVEVADHLVLYKRPRRRNSSETSKSKKKSPSVRYNKVVTEDGVHHLPTKGPRGRCRWCHTAKTNVFCKKCQIRFCFNDNRECFTEAHER